MAVAASLSRQALSVDPGGTVLLEVKVRNRGSVVDQFTFQVLGSPAPWAVVEPESLSLFPGAEGTVFLRFDVPRSSDIPTGDLPFAVRVVSAEDPEGSIVEEGVLTVSAFAHTAAELVPRTSRGARGAKHELALDNYGNSRVNATLSGTDPENALLFAFRPPAIVAEPGTAAFSTVAVRPRKTFLRGPAKTRPFHVVVDVQGQEPLRVDGSMLQEPVLAAWVVRAAIAALALLLLLVVLWFALLRPAVRSAAVDAVDEPLGQTNAAVNDLGAAVGQSPQLPTGDVAGKAGKGQAGGAGQPGGPGGDGTDPAAPKGSGAAAILTTFGNPFDRRLAVSGSGTLDAGFTVDAGKVFSLTDVVLQNPAGDSGTVTLLRGDDVVFLDSLANFRNLDYHFVSPLVFDEGSQVTFRVDCANAGRACTPAVHLSGFLKNKPRD